MKGNWRHLLPLFVLPFFVCSCTEEKQLESRIEELNKRIDQLEITSDEILVRATSMNELELVVKAMEERQETRMRNVIRRENLAKRRVAKIEGDMQEMEEKARAMEMAAESFTKASDGELNEARSKLESMMKNIDGSVDLTPNEVVLLERLFGMVKALKEENAQLRSALEAKK